MAKQIIDVAVKDLLTDGNIRTVIDEAAVRGLATSMEQQGCIEPIIVRAGDKRADGTKPYRIISGHRRAKAAELLEWKTIPALLWDGTNNEALEVQLVENTQREDMNAIDTANAIKKLKEVVGLKQEIIAQKLGMTGAGVSQYLSVLSLDEKDQKKLIDGTLQFGKAVEMAKVKDPASREKVAAAKNTKTARAESKKVREEKGEKVSKRKSKKEPQTIRTREEIETRLAKYDDKISTLNKEIKDLKKVKEEEQDLKKISKLQDNVLLLIAKAEELTWILLIEVNK